MKQIILSLIFWTGLLACSITNIPLNKEEVQKITFDKEYFKTQEEIYTKENRKNPFIYQEIKKDLYFNYIFVSNEEKPDNCITIQAKDIKKTKNYSEKTHDKLLSLPLVSSDILTFFFKEHFSKEAFMIFKGCLSYAFDTKKNVIIHQELSGQMNDYFNQFEYGNELAFNFRNVANQKDNTNIVTVYVILNNKEVDYFKANFFVLSDNKDLLKTLLSNENLQEVAATFNDVYKAEINGLANNFITNTFFYGGNWYLKHSQKIHFALSSGMILAQLYFTYSALKNGYNYIGSLRSFGKNPKTSTGTVKALLNAGALSITLYKLYGYTQSGLSWVKSKIKNSKPNDQQ